MEIVGLKNFVQDDVNRLIAKFVGFKHPVAEIFSKKVGKDAEYFVEHTLNVILVMKQGEIQHKIFKSYWKLSKLKNDKERRGEFIKLKRWLKRELLTEQWYLTRLFKNSKINQVFLNKQKQICL